MRSCLVLLVLMLPVAAWGQAMSDPTRPPFGLDEGVALSAKSSSVAKAKGLLSVIISADRCAAIIDGKTFRLGERYGDAILVEIKPQGVVLQSARGLRSMKLFPEVGMKVTVEQSPSSSVALCKLGNLKFENQDKGSSSSRKTGLKEKR